MNSTNLASAIAEAFC